MNKIKIGAALWCAVLSVSAQRADSVRVSRLDEARVVTNRATKTHAVGVFEFGQKSHRARELRTRYPLLAFDAPDA